MNVKRKIMDSNNPVYSVLIPIYRSSAMIEELYTRLTAVMESIGEPYEIVMVDDGSPDDSWHVLERIHERDGRVKIIQLMKNAGQPRALMCGFSHVSGEYIITMDDDLQHPPEEIPKLIRGMEADPSLDAVIGEPEEKRHSMIRKAISEAYNIINSHIFGKSRDLRMAPFRLIRRQVVEELTRQNIYNPIIGTMLLSITVNMKNVTVDHHERKSGRSTYTVGRIIKASLDSILQNSTLPLRIISSMGMIISIVSIIYGIYNIVQRLYMNIKVPGWTSLMVVNLFLFGMVLFSLGIIGEYLIRIIQSTHQIPPYTIRQKHM